MHIIQLKDAETKLKYRIVSLLLILFGVMLIGAQTLPGVKSIDRLWQPGETRLYRFIADTVHEIGTLEVTMAAGEEGRFSFSHKLSLEFSKVDKGENLSIEGNLSVFASGLFHAADMEIKLGDKQADIEASFDESSLAVRGREENGVEQEFDIPVNGAVFLYESFMPYQLELALASHEFIPGENILFPSVSLQNRYATDYEVTVSGKFGTAGARNVDSVWALVMLRPEQLLLYFDEGKRLIKVVDDANSIEINLVSVKLAPGGQGGQSTKSKSLTAFRDRLPIFGIYLAVASLGLLVLAQKGYSNKFAYVLLLIGGGLFPLIYLLHDPLQLSYGRSVLRGAEEGLAWRAIPAAIFTGLIYQGLKFVPLLIIKRIKDFKAESWICLGAFVGAGFGLVDAFASEQSGTKILTILYALNNISMILFHLLTGALIGYGLACRKQITYFLIAVLLHAITIYIWIFVNPSLSAAQTLLAIRQMVIVTGLFHLTLFVGFFFLKRRFLSSLNRYKGKR